MPAPFDYGVLEISDEELARERATYGALADAVRRLAETSLRTTVPDDVIEQARERIDEVTALLAAETVPGPLGVQLTTGGGVRDYGNAVVGLRNPVAPPLAVVQDKETGSASAEFELNALYEGPPGCVHGGVAALLLDQLCGEAAAAGGHPGMTGTLSLRYVRPTPLGRLSATARLARVEGVKAIVEGELRDTDGQVTVTCEGVFILPRWARELIDQAPPKYE